MLRRRQSSFIAVMLIALGMVAGCSKKQSRPQVQAKPDVASNSADAGDTWHLELKISPDHPSMTKPMTLALRITDEHGQPVNDAKVNGSLNMKLMDMGVVAVKFDPKGNGTYEGSTKSMDMSGPYNLAVDATQGGTHVTKNFDVNVFD